MTRLTALLLTTAILFFGACGNDDDPSATPPARKEPIRLGAGGEEIVLASALKPFDRCEAFLDHVKAEATKLADKGWYPFGGMRVSALAATGGVATEDRAMAAGAAQESAAPTTAAPQPGQDYSGTNVQEAGVDEPDIVKTDGRRLVTVADGNRLQVVDLTDDKPRVASTVTLADYGDQLFLSGDRVLVIGQGSFERPVPMDAPASGAREGISAPVPGYWQPASVVTVVDITDIARPSVVTTMRLEGAFVSGRLVDGRVRLVVHAGASPVVQPGGTPEQTKQAIAESEAGDWLPSFKQQDANGNVVEGELVRCEDTYRPVDFSGPQTLTVVTIDPKDPKPGETASVLGGAQTVYASAENLYASTTEYDPQGGEASKTQIHKFSIAGDGPAKYLASGEVPGALLNQFSMSEHEGNLRVASTNGFAAVGSGSESAVTVLAQDGEALKPIGSVGGLGKDERIYSVRFIGDMGYVVTFRQTDPLYVIDLSDPAKPEVKGELKILGYSAYLHPIGDGLLLGVGQDATEEGRRLGLQLSVFDVTDPTNPTRKHQLSLRQLFTEAEYDHHAFLYWAKTGLTVLPVHNNEGRPSAVAFDVDAGDGITEKGRVTHRAGGVVRRSVVLGDRLLTLSDAGILVNDLESLEERGWLAF